MSADDNEFDFVNPEEEEAHLNNAEEEEEQQGERGGGRRGPDIAWREVDRYIILGGGLNDPQLPKTREVFVSRQFWVHFFGGGRGGPGESSCHEGSEYVWQRGVGSQKCQVMGGF